MQVIAKEAVKKAWEDHKVDLDYTPDSIERLDEMLESIHQSHVKHPLTEAELSVLCLQWGAYIGEAIKRVHPGKWRRDFDQMGPGTIPLVSDSGEQAFPRSWVCKRIMDGEFDSVVTKFRIFSYSELLRNAEPHDPETPAEGSES